MKKVAIALMFISMAVFMLHAFIPHHHHDAIACFVGEEPEGHTGSCSHQHEPAAPCSDSDDPARECALHDMLALIPDLQKNSRPTVLTDMADHAVIEFPDFMVSSPEASDPPLLAHLIESPPDPGDMMIYCNRVHGLRAPPTC